MISSIYHKLIFQIERLLRYKYWYFYTAIATAIVIIILNYPSYYPLSNRAHPCDACVNFQQEINRADHLLTPSKYPDGDHMAKTQLRLTIPLIAKLLGTRSKIEIFLLQECLGLVFLIISCLLSFKLTQDKVVSAVITLSLGFIYAGKAAFVDTEGFTDSFAYCFLLISLFSRYRLVIFASLLLAYFTDERSILSSAIIALFFLGEYLRVSRQKFNLKLFLGSKLCCIGLSWIACIAIRYSLFRLYGLHTPSDGANTVNVQKWDYIFWEGLQGFWLVIIGACFYLFFEKKFFIMFLFVAFILAMMLGVSMVADLTRSIAYIFPVIFVSLYFLEKGVSRPELRKIIIMSSLISFLSSGSFYIAGQDPYFYHSLPVKLMGKVLSKL